MGDHSETIQVDYDPTQISYAELLDEFWDSHDPTARPYTEQYASIIFYHNEEQKRLALETRDREASRRGGPLFTKVRSFSEFYLAEEYHQKYRLRQNLELLQDFLTIYPDSNGLLNSTAAARVNGHLGGNGTLEVLRSQLDGLGLSVEGKERLLDSVSAFGP